MTEKEVPDKENIKLRKNRVGLVKFAFVLIFFALAGIIGFAGYWGVMLLIEEKEKFTSEVNSLKANFSVLEKNNSRQLKELAALERQATQLSSSLRDVQQRLTGHNKRLRELSKTTRADWVLAEAEFLLKLANQRIVIENDVDGASRLMAEVDSILLSLKDLDLHHLREIVLEDLTTLKSVEKFDAQGVYLRLSALAVLSETLDVLSFSDNIMKIDNIKVDFNEEVSWLGNVKNSFLGFLGGLQNYVQIVKHDEKNLPFLTPDYEIYVRQNFRMMIEKAQIALMRGNQTTYTDSLSSAEQWLEQYFFNSNNSANFRTELKTLRGVVVEQDKPDISRSLELMQDLIEERHGVNGGQILLKSEES